MAVINNEARFAWGKLAQAYLANIWNESINSLWQYVVRYTSLIN
jgi:hypothetical protein